VAVIGVGIALALLALGLWVWRRGTSAEQWREHQPCRHYEPELDEQAEADR
jgi:hypothetical protein